MKICIVSDSHDNRALLAAAATAAKQQGAEALLHCGDVVAPAILSVLQPLGLPVHVIHGNNSGDLQLMTRIASRPGSVVRYYGQDAGIRLGGRRIFIVHYPHSARTMAATGDWDLVCYGHDHTANIERVPNIKGGHTLLVNPGTVAGIDAKATYAMGDLETLRFTLHAIAVELFSEITGDDIGEQPGFQNV